MPVGIEPDLQVLAQVAAEEAIADAPLVPRPDVALLYVLVHVNFRDLASSLATDHDEIEANALDQPRLHQLIALRLRMSS